MLDFGIVVELFANEILYSGALFRGCKAFELLSELQQLFPGKCPCADQHFYHGKQFLIAEKFLHGQVIAPALVGISELCITNQRPVIGEKRLEIIDAAGDTLGGNIIFLRQRLHRESFAPQPAKKQLQQPLLS